MRLWLALVLAVFLVGPVAVHALSGRPPDWPCTPRELFSRWLEATGGGRWKALWDITARIEDRIDLGLFKSESSQVLAVQAQPRVKARSVAVEDGKLVVKGFDGSRYWQYSEETPYEERLRYPWKAHGELKRDIKTRDDVREEFESTLFWLAIPYNLITPQTDLRAAGTAKGRHGADLLLLEVGLTRIPGGYGLDRLLCAIDPETYLPEWIDYEDPFEPEVKKRCAFDKYRRVFGLAYPEYRIFSRNGADVRWVRMTEVRCNRGYHGSVFAIPGS